MIRTRRERSVLLWLPIVAALLAVDCNSSTATSPSVVGITFTSSSLAVGGTVTAMIALGTPAPSGGTVVSLSSSNAAVVTVPASVLIDAGASNGAVVITAIGVGTATITATVGTYTSQSAVVTVSASTAALVSVSLNPTSVVGGTSVTGTVTLNGQAPAGGAIVSLAAVDPASTAPTITVPAGQTSVTFTVSTRSVGGTIAATVSGSYGGVTMSAMLSVMPFVATVATANFGVTGPSETETCELSNSGATLNCTFNGTTSTAPGTITEWDWTYGVSKVFQQTTTGPILTKPTVDCSMVPPPPLPASPGWFTMIVTLTIHDSLGHVSTTAMDTGVRLFPQGSCGF